MTTAAYQIPALLDELGFAAVEPHKAMGIPGGIPTTLTLLSTNPLALLFGFRVQPDGKETQPVLNLLRDINLDRATVTFDDGTAWLSLYDLSGLSNSSIRMLVEKFAETISATDLAVAPGCLRCAETADANLLYIDGRATRLCPGCVAEAHREKREIDAQLNPASISATIGLPAVCAYVACGWAGFWTLTDMAFEHWQVNVIEINKVTFILALVLAGGVGYCLGVPLGAALRQSIAIRRAPKTMSLVFVLAAVLGGEVGCLALRILRLAGVFDLKLAARLLGLVLASYSGFWILVKLAFAAAICLFCIDTSSRRKTANLNV